MKAICLHNKDEIESFFRHNTLLHLYALGDLDDFFWQYTTWYALREDSCVTEIALLYTGGSLPTLLALTDNASRMQELLKTIMPLLPKRLDAHLSGDLAAVFARDYHVQPYGNHTKLALTQHASLSAIDTSQVVRLSRADLVDLETLYSISYPGNWFDPRMLETGYYYGIRANNELVSVAGIHVYSQRYRIATIGNVTTHPSFRGRQLATAACAKLCQDLLLTVDHIGLNVKSDNAGAIACYERLGFERIATYEECGLIFG